MRARAAASAIFWVCASALVVAPLSAWAAAAVWFRLPLPVGARAAACGLIALGAVATIAALFTRARWRGLLLFALAFAGVILWWGSIRPPADGNWAPDVARQTTGALNGDILTLSDVREFEWTSDADFKERWSRRSYDLSKLKTLDLFLSYWAGPQMAHLIMSFGFDNDEQLAWSIEVRREKNGAYSPVADAFKTHTIVYLAASERDVVRLRSNVRREDVRLYRLRTPPDQARVLLMQYVGEANALAAEPAFYNSITTNCTTAVAKLIWAAGGTLPLDWRLVVNGYLPGYLYDRRAVDTAIPLNELIERARIDDRARAADQSPDFSRLIRVGVPAPDDKALP
jgi:hypothetical protein